MKEIIQAESVHPFVLILFVCLFVCFLSPDKKIALI